MKREKEEDSPGEEKEREGYIKVGKKALCQRETLARVIEYSIQNIV